jgi:uncharacterized protein YprB with RNaseH-like and TPR domain
MPSILYLDIETCPAAPGWSPPEPIEAAGNLKDPEKIAADIAAKTAKAYGATSFDVHEGRLLCVGLAVDDDEPTICYDEGLTDTPRLLDEVAAAWNDALRRGNGRAVICGHNVAAFDLPWIWRLAVKHRHLLAASLPWRKWGDGYADTMQMWSLTNPQERVSLAKIARFLGIGGKDEGLTGAEVWPAYQRGEHDRIARYCAGDVRLVREVYWAMMVGR